MFKNVLVGVGGRPSGRDAIALASHLLDPDGKLTLIHVHGGELRPNYAFSPDVVAEDREASQTLLEEERTAAEVTAELLGVAADHPGRALHEQAELLAADLIVVGSCAHGAIGRAMLGDDTRAALNGAPCAVAVAPHGYAQHTTTIATVGVAYNSTPESEAALSAARIVAAATGASVHALEVVMLPRISQPALMGPGFGARVEAMIHAALSRMEDLPDVDAHAVYGLPGEELAAFGDQVDLLVLGSRGYGPLKRLVYGSTCDYLERHARCALLVLPRAARNEVRASARSPTRARCSLLTPH